MCIRDRSYSTADATTNGMWWNHPAYSSSSSSYSNININATANTNMASSNNLSVPAQAEISGYSYDFQSGSIVQANQLQEIQQQHSATSDPYYGSYSTLAGYETNNLSTQTTVEMGYQSPWDFQPQELLPEWRATIAPFYSDSPVAYDLGYSAIVMGQQQQLQDASAPPQQQQAISPAIPPVGTSSMPTRPVSDIPPPPPPRRSTASSQEAWVFIPDSTTPPPVPAKPNKPKYEVYIDPYTQKPMSSVPLHRLNSRERSALEQQFRRFDKNADDKMDREEFKGSLGLFFTSSKENASVWYGGLLADLLFRAFDNDCDGQISCGEFLNAIATLRYGTPAEKLDLAWRVIDVRRRGFIIPEDLTAVVKSMYSVLQAMKIELDYYGLDWWINSVFERLDIKRSGFITRDDYLSNALLHSRLITGLGLSQYDYYYSPSSSQDQMDSSAGERLVLFGDNIFSWIVTMMLGIRLAGQRVAKQAHEHKPVLSFDDFSTKNMLVIPNNASSSLYIPFVNAFTFSDYSPMVFYFLRRKYGIDEREYLLALGPEQVLGNTLIGNLGALRMQVSEGKSGSYFFKTRDKKIFVKTISLSEEFTLKRILPMYFRHMEANPHSLITYFFGFHKVNITPFVVMNNAFNTRLPIHEFYDLKGSTIGRTNPTGKGILKDLDLKKPIRLGPAGRQQLLTQIDKDVKLLESLEVIDYSLIVGIHYRDRYTPDNTVNSGTTLFPQRHLPFHQLVEGGMMGYDQYGNPTNEIFFFGIIDILTGYGLFKATENWINSVLKPTGFSCVPPMEYAARFMGFLAKVIV
eukprot:TRINITY_DN6194_c1_g1_i7.p1 TRINITY_DN6194_c1_g1~~TRINITY_DN6194_c1_g1_i7.p1  ORF type:complete len:803 (-),score=175.70 TRINITY_DN6194_c1_g1_i7:84-2492(-)